jgi:small membrane protein
MKFQHSQVLLILTIVAFLIYVFRLRTVVLERMIYLAFGLGGVVVILYPDVSTRLANHIGIGRGADLLLYIFIIFSLFHYVNITARFKRIERQMTEVVRSVALAEAMRDTSSHPRNMQEGSR